MATKTINPAGRWQIRIVADGKREEYIQTEPWTAKRIFEFALSKVAELETQGKAVTKIKVWKNDGEADGL